MEFSSKKAVSLRPVKEKYFATFLIALTVATAFFVPYMILGEGYFTFYGDFNVQQIPFYQQCHKAVLEGNIFWSTTTDLGANFIGSYSFYLLGSPFFWITLLFPNSFVPYLMGPLLILKFACAALTAYMYIRRFTRTPEAACLGGLLYAFSGFSVYNIFFNHFHEAIIVFPLLLLSMELLITENRRFCFALMVAVCAITNYFFFFGMVVFAVIYFFVRIFSKSIKVGISRFLVLVFEAVLGLCLSAILLVPSIMAITGNYRISEILLGWTAMMYGKEQIYANVLQCFFFPPDIPARPVFFPGADVKWSSLGGWLPVFSMVGIFTWFSQKKRNWIGRLLGICIFMSLVPILNSAFYAFNTAYYARWFYMPILIMCLATVRLTEDNTVDWGYGYKWVFGITLAVSLVIGLFPQKDDEDNLIFGIFTDSQDYTYIFRFWLSCAIAILGLAVLGLLLRTWKNNKKSFYKRAIAAVCIMSVLYANVFIATGRAHSYDVKKVVIDQLIEGEIDFNDNQEFRIDVYDGVDNTSMYLGYSGINAFHSVVPASIFEFYDFIGVERSVGSRPDTAYSALRPLLSVKYLLDSKEVGEDFVDEEDKISRMEGYKYISTQSGYYIYENENYVPYGFSYNYYMDYDFCKSYTDKSKAAMMLKAVLLTDEQIKKYGNILENIENIESDYSGTTLSLTEEEMIYDCDGLRETSAEYFKTDNRGFEAKVYRDEKNLVFFSIPYDEGWSATVNGKPVQIEKVNVGFMAVLVDKGYSTIRFNYTTPGLFTGIKITVFASAIFLIYIMAFALYNRKHKKDTPYPEGEILMKEWRAQEIDELRTMAEKNYVKPSILDDVAIEIPSINEGFEGGFKISSDVLEDDDT